MINEWKLIGDNDIINHGGLMIRHLTENEYQVIDISPEPYEDRVLASMCKIDIGEFTDRTDILHFGGYDELAGKSIEVIKDAISPECFAADIVSCIGIENLAPFSICRENWFVTKAFVRHWLSLMGCKVDKDVELEEAELTVGKLRNYIEKLQLPDDTPVFVGCQGYTNYEFGKKDCEQDTIATIHNNCLFILDSVSVADKNGVPL